MTTKICISSKCKYHWRSRLLAPTICKKHNSKTTLTFNVATKGTTTETISVWYSNPRNASRTPIHRIITHPLVSLSWTLARSPPLCPCNRCSRVPVLKAVMFWQFKKDPSRRNRD